MHFLNLHNPGAMKRRKITFFNIVINKISSFKSVLKKFLCITRLVYLIIMLEFLIFFIHRIFHTMINSDFQITRLSCTAAAQATGGLVINLLSNDVARFEQLFLFLHYTWVMPMQGAVIAYLIWRHVGVASLAGVLLMTMQTIPVQGA